MKENRVYAKLRKTFLAEHPFCAVAMEGIALTRNELPLGEFVPSTQIHHRAGRGKRLNETRYWMAVSLEGHAWIHAHGKEARARGWILDL